MVNIANGATKLLAVAPDNPRFTLLGTTRFNIPARSMVIDNNNIAYLITLSGLSVVPLTPNGAATPQLAATRAIVNAQDGTANLRIGGVININGTNLAGMALASTLPPPTVLGGSCVTFNDVALPLLQTAAWSDSGADPNDSKCRLERGTGALAGQRPAKHPGHRDSVDDGRRRGGRKRRAKRSGYHSRQPAHHAAVNL